MLQEESDLSLIIAQIVQKLKGSNLYAQLERQAWVSEDVGRGGDPRGRGDARALSASGRPKPEPASALFCYAPGHGKSSLPLVSSTCSVLGVGFIFKLGWGTSCLSFRPENR